jgi:tetratricopeptide (TPR) repeat protein
LIDKGNAVAVSVRNFRVGGIRGLPNMEGIMTIKTALQVAVQYQTKGMEAQAESIYRSVLAENPTYPDALHLLGVVLYKRGDAQLAVEYVEKAVQSTGNDSFAAFYNTLGACYRTLGRVEEAEEQFKMALKINPEFVSAIFNLGLVYQQQYLFDKAIEQYQNVSFYSQLYPQAVSLETVLESKIRECDLKQTINRFQEALDCWRGATIKYPKSSIVFHEMANLQAQVGFVNFFGVIFLIFYFLAWTN